MGKVVDKKKKKKMDKVISAVIFFFYNSCNLVKNGNKILVTINPTN